jgi:hypothetical protein
MKKKSKEIKPIIKSLLYLSLKKSKGLKKSSLSKITKKLFLKDSIYLLFNIVSLNLKKKKEKNKIYKKIYERNKIFRFIIIYFLLIL